MFAELSVGGKTRENVGGDIRRAVCQFGGGHNLGRADFVRDDWDEPGYKVFCYCNAEGLVSFGVQGIRG